MFEHSYHAEDSNSTYIYEIKLSEEENDTATFKRTGQSNVLYLKSLKGILRQSDDNPIEDSPFDHIVSIEKKEREKIIKKIKTLPLPFADKLQSRMQLLSEDTEEEYPNVDFIPIKSIEGFLRFLTKKVTLPYPDTTISANGNVRAQWQKDSDHHLAIEFISNIEAKVVIFTPDPFFPMKTNRISGRISIDSIPSVIGTLGVLEWLACGSAGHRNCSALMPDTGQFSVETLHHFRCCSCTRWWSIASIPEASPVFAVLQIPGNPLETGKPVWYCPWCGTKQEVKEASGELS